MLDKYITVPGTNSRIYEKSVVILNRFPKMKWILLANDSQESCSSEWYFYSVPPRARIPVYDSDLSNLVIVSRVNRGEQMYYESQAASADDQSMSKVRRIQNGC